MDTKNEKDQLEIDNKRNGYSTKTVKTQFGEMPIDIPRDRNGEFEPIIFPKYQRNISGIEEKVVDCQVKLTHLLMCNDLITSAL